MAAKAVATRTNFLFRGVVDEVHGRENRTRRDPDGRLLADRKENSKVETSEEIRKKEHAHSVQFPQTKYLNLERLGNFDNTSDEEIGARVTFALEKVSTNLDTSSFEL